MSQRQDYYRRRAERRRLSVFGMASKTSQYGTTLTPTNASEEFYIRVTSKGTMGLNGQYPYSWERVVRDSQNTWQSTGQTGGPGFDPAYEANNADSPIATIYRAYRDTNTGQLLFF